MKKIYISEVRFERIILIVKYLNFIFRGFDSNTKHNKTNVCDNFENYEASLIFQCHGKLCVYERSSKRRLWIFVQLLPME